MPLTASVDGIPRPEVYVFLEQELERQSGNRSLVETVVDSLIIWSLEETNPDHSLFMKRNEIITKINEAVPTAKNFIKELIDTRLAELNKRVGGVRKINCHSPQNHVNERKYCLPFETRKTVELENAEDESLRITVIEGFRRRAGSYFREDDQEAKSKMAADVALKAVQFTFEREGMAFASFLSKDEKSNDNALPIADCAEEIIRDLHIGGEASIELKDIVVNVLRESFYNSSEAERLLFSKLSRTYALMFGLKADPRVVEYFQTMTANFYLYVGTDILVRALSERYLPEEDRMTRNLLSMLAQAGATLVLSEPVLLEIYHHIQVSDEEFKHHHMRDEQWTTIELARQSPKILIRSYFYAKLDHEGHVGSPKNWYDYINQFCSYQNLRKPEGLAEVKDYILAQFHMRFEDAEVLDGLINEDELKHLSSIFSDIKQNEQLAINDAKLTLAIYGRRNALNEKSEVSGFGFRTWWLTGETAILRDTKALINKNNGIGYIMRPEFLLNFIALAPSTEEVRSMYRKVFPSLLGIRLSRRMNTDEYHKIMDKIEEYHDMDPGRALALAQSVSNKLKGDPSKVFLHQFEDSSE